MMTTIAALVASASIVAAHLLSLPAAPTAEHRTVPAATIAPSVVDADRGPLVVPTVTVVGSPRSAAKATNRPAAKVSPAAASRPLTFVCGPVHGNDVGGRNSDCEWK